MKLEGEQILLRVFLRNTLRYSGWYSAADALLRSAVRQGLVGETTLQGFLGLDNAGQVVEPGRWSLVQTRPLVLEFLDSPGVICSFLTDVVGIVPVGLATLERVKVLAYRRKTVQRTQLAEHLAKPDPDGHILHLPSPEEFPIMRTTIEGQLLRVFVDDTDTFEGKQLYRALIEKAHDLGMTNAVVLRAPMGFGTHRRIHTDRFPDYITDLPILVEIVGTAQEVARILPFLDEAIPEGLVTLEDVRMLKLGKTATQAALNQENTT